MKFRALLSVQVLLRGDQVRQGMPEAEEERWANIDTNVFANLG